MSLIPDNVMELYPDGIVIGRNTKVGSSSLTGRLRKYAVTYPVLSGRNPNLMTRRLEPESKAEVVVIHKGSPLNGVDLGKRFSFLFVRNPFIRFVSSYEHIIRKEWITDDIDISLAMDIFKRSDQERIQRHAIDRQVDLMELYPFEYIYDIDSMDEFMSEFVTLLQNMGIETTVPNDAKRLNINPNKIDVAEVYRNNPSLEKQVREHFREDFEMWGDQFNWELPT